jgi:hypothetical protein
MLVANVTAAQASWRSGRALPTPAEARASISTMRRSGPDEEVCPRRLPGELFMAGYRPSTAPDGDCAEVTSQAGRRPERSGGAGGRANCHPD